MAEREHRYGVGERTDGTLDTFPMSEWPARREELRAMLAGETESDDLADLSEVEALFEPPKGTITKAEAEYVEPGPDDPTRCIGCKMFRDPDACTLVRGAVSPDGHCKHFEPDEDGAAEDEFNEADHPRGQPENAGEFARSGGGGKSETKPDIRKSMNKVTEVAASTQPVKSLDELYQRAQAEEPAFRKMVEDIAEVTGSKPKFGVDKQTGSILKTRESSERKLRDELDGDFTKLRDVLRGTVVGDSVEKTRDSAATFIAKQGENILRVKDRHVGPTSSGYRDILVNFRTPGGLVAELQFNSKAMTEAKEASGHKLYDAIRGGELAGKTFDELQAAARAIYEKAYVDDGDGHWEMT